MTIEKFKLFNKRLIDPITKCWLWTGARGKKGKGIVLFDGQIRNVARVSAHIFLGLGINDIINQALHKKFCSNTKLCFNPEHLYIGTHNDNMRDCRELGDNKNQNSYKTHCIHGHEFRGDNLIIEKGKRVCRTCRNEGKKRRRLNGVKY